jgi:hypothetical protein
MRRGTGKVPAKDSTGPGAWRKVTLTQPKWLESAGVNLARRATVHVPGEIGSAVKTYLLLNDGNGKVEDNNGRWLQRAGLPHIVEFRWDKPVDLGAARIISGYFNGQDVIAPINAFSLEWRNGEKWNPITRNVSGNTDPAWATTFSSVRTDRARLVVTKTQDDISRIWEVEFYQPVRPVGN